jgi:hypothetical protein
MTIKHQLAYSDIENAHNSKQPFKTNGTSGEQRQTATTTSSKYYEYLHSTTKEGFLFNIDFSSDPDVPQGSLTEKEIEERTAHYDTLQKLYKHYNTALKHHPECTTQEDILQQRIVAPYLATGEVSSRSSLNKGKVSGLYPPTIKEWKGFQSEVENYNLEQILTPCLPMIMEAPFLYSLKRAKCYKITDKVKEQKKLVGDLIILREAGIIKGVGRSNGRGIGDVDFFIMKDDTAATILCVFKATHNLLLPMHAIECVTKYNSALKEMSTRDENSIEDPTLEWSTTAQPLGQLIAYMVDNTMYYGSLTSGTHTYFVKIQSANVTTTTGYQPQLQLYISDAWFVGQVNYLRAWAYMHHLGDINAQQQQQWVSLLPPASWMRSTLNYAAPCQSTIGYDSSCGMTNSVYTMLPHVHFNDIDILGVLGTGRNGACFKVKWNGTEYAMKQFDIIQHGTKYFHHELEAYMILKDAWGDLVPQPVFTSQSYTGGVQFFGLQLGWEPTKLDNFYTNSYKILKRLETEYGICHNDAEDRNMIIILNADGMEKMVAIDFENWDHL